MSTSIHPSVRDKINNLLKCEKIPHLLFHGKNGTGKRTIVSELLNIIYENDELLLKCNTLTVECTQHRKIEFIREVLIRFVKLNVDQTYSKTKNVKFRTVVLLNCDNLTTASQSALRRIVEVYSNTTRFFIVVAQKKILQPILSRFCDIFVPELEVNHKRINLHYDLATIQFQEENKNNQNAIISNRIPSEININTKQAIEICQDLIHAGITSFDFVHWVQQNTRLDELLRIELEMKFHTIRYNFRCEKLLILILLSFITA